MKRLILTAAGLLLLAALCFTACDDSAPADTTAPDLPDAVTDAPTDVPTETPTEIPTDTPTDAVTDGSVTETPTESFTPPTADPTEADAAGLPLDGNSYTLGGENPSVAPKTQYEYLKTYAHAYADKTLTVYGHLRESADGMMVISLGEGADLVVYFSEGNAPVTGSYVKLTGNFTKTVDKGEYVDFACFTVMATACEVLEEAQGPNGGRFMYITASSLNVRSTPDSSVSDNKVGLLYSGDMVEVLETELGSNSNWCKIVFDCDAGYAYISMTYISETKP